MQYVSQTGDDSMYVSRRFFFDRVRQSLSIIIMPSTAHCFTLGQVQDVSLILWLQEKNGERTPIRLVFHRSLNNLRRHITMRLSVMGKNRIFTAFKYFLPVIQLFSLNLFSLNLII